MATSTEQKYTITALGTLPGGSVSVARAINSAGWIVGEADVNGTLHAFLYTPATLGRRSIPASMIDLGTIGELNTVAMGVSDRGLVVGCAATGGNGSQAFVCNNAGPLRPLGLFVGRSVLCLGASSAPGNGTPQNFAAGYSEAADGTRRAFLLTDDQTQELVTPSGGGSAAAAVNPVGIVVGAAESSGGATHAFLYQRGQMLDLGTLGGMNSSATAINAAGQVVGSAEVVGGAGHAFLFSDRRMQDLGTLGGSSSSATAINATGRVVGTSENAAGRTNAFLFDGSMVNLNRLLPPGSGWEILTATGINDLGQIVGCGIYNQQGRAFMMAPIPG